MSSVQLLRPIGVASMQALCKPCCYWFLWITHCSLLDLPCAVGDFSPTDRKLRLEPGNKSPQKSQAITYVWLIEEGSCYDKDKKPSTKRPSINETMQANDDQKGQWRSKGISMVSLFVGLLLIIAAAWLTRMRMLSVAAFHSYSTAIQNLWQSSQRDATLGCGAFIVKLLVSLTSSIKRSSD